MPFKGKQGDLAKARAARRTNEDGKFIGGGVRRDAQGFTPHERLFIGHYLNAGLGKGAEAARLAGIGGKNPRGFAYTLLQRPHVIAEIDRQMEARSQELRVSASDVLRDLVVLKTDAEQLGINVQTVRARREILASIGDHVAVGAFRRNVGVSGPGGGPIEFNVSILERATPEELSILERAREILDRLGALADGDPERGDAESGEGEAGEG